MVNTIRKGGFELAARDMQVQMLLHKIVEIEFSHTCYDPDYWCDVFAETMTLKDGTMVDDDDIEYIQNNFECWFYEKYRNWLY